MLCNNITLHISTGIDVGAGIEISAILSRFPSFPSEQLRHNV